MFSSEPKSLGVGGGEVKLLPWYQGNTTLGETILKMCDWNENHMVCLVEDFHFLLVIYEIKFNEISFCKFFFHLMTKFFWSGVTHTKENFVENICQIHHISRKKILKFPYLDKNLLFSFLSYTQIWLIFSFG